MTLQKQDDILARVTYGDFDQLLGQYLSTLHEAGPIFDLDVRGWYSEMSPDPLKLNDMESSLSQLKGSISRIIDIGLENRNLLEQLHEQGEQAQLSGMGAIHSLDGGRVQLAPPLFYNLQMFDDEVLAGIDELKVYGVGASEPDAVAKLQKELWELFKELDQLPQDELGVQLVQTLRVIKSRIEHNALDA